MIFIFLIVIPNKLIYLISIRLLNKFNSPNIVNVVKVFNFCIFVKIGVEDMTDSTFREITDKYLDVFSKFGSGEKLDEVDLFFEILPTLDICLSD
jgi:hypothetical protein